MVIVVTERKRKAFESKIEGADKVEIKITVAKKNEQRAYEALEIERRDIYFFDMFYSAIEHHFSVFDTSRLWGKGRLCFLYARSGKGRGSISWAMRVVQEGQFGAASTTLQRR